MERKLGVSVFSSFFMWGGILPVENDFEWQSGLKNFCPLSFINRELLLFPFHFLSIFDRESFFFFLLFFSLFSSFSFLSFHFFLFFLFTFPSLSLSLGNRVLACDLLSLEEIPLSFASGERMRILLIGQGSKSLRLCFNGVFYRGNPILISGAKQIWVSRCRFRAELPYYSIRHA